MSAPGVARIAVMLPKTIRWRLPLSYAGIALIAALALGAVLLLNVRGYYAEREQDLMLGNARAVAARMAALVREQPAHWLAEARDSQVQGLGFLAQARVQILDPNETVVADSGSPVPRAIFIARETLPPGMVVTYTKTVSGDVVRGVTSSRQALRVETHLAMPGADAGADMKYLFINAAPISLGATFSTPITETPAMAGMLTEDILTGLPAIGTPFGFSFGFDAVGDMEVDGRRSDQVVRQPFNDLHGELLGYVQLSEGPAYGVQIVDSVARGWLIASLVAVAVAAGAGWLASRSLTRPLVELTAVTARMAQGDLAARAAVSRDDELGVLAGSFNDMASRIEDMVVTLRRFVADAAHELNTPLTALRTNLELANRSTNETTNEERINEWGSAALERAQQQVARLEQLAGSLLDLSRLEGQDARLRSDVLDIALLARSIAEVFASRAEQIGLQFGLDVPGSAVFVQGDETQLQRALGNLLDNAIKFTPEGGSVTLGVREAGGQVTVWVEDTGIGVPADDMPSLFGRFHRARNAAAYPGNGLGLAIVKAIVDGHGGHIRVEHVSPHGLRVAIDLPASSA